MFNAPQSVDVVISSEVLALKPGIAKFTSIKNLPPNTTINNLVYHTSPDTPEEVIATLSTVKYNRLIYISSPQKKREEVLLFVRANGGDYFEDDIYLKDMTFLDEVLNTPGISKELALQSVDSSFDVVSSFIERTSVPDFKPSPAFLKQTADAISTVITLYDGKDKELVRASEVSAHALRQFAESTSRSVMQSREYIDQLAHVRSQLEALTKTSSVSSLGNASSATRGIYYQSYRYSNSQECLVIKELGTVPFLTSFVLGLQAYLESKRQSTVVVVLLPPGEAIAGIYANLQGVDASFIDVANMKSSHRAYQAKVIFTNHPVQHVMSNIVKQKYHRIIFLDRTKVSPKPLVLPREGNIHFKQVYAVQSERVRASFSINANQCFSSVLPVNGSMFTYGEIRPYPVRVESRINAYLENCSGFYKKLTGI